MSSATPTLNFNFRQSLLFASRLLAASVGAYCATAALSAFLVVALPLPTADATVLSTMLSFAVLCGLIIIAFGIKSLTVVWALMMGLYSFSLLGLEVGL
ncbi:hypothetical protein [Shewanella sp. GXUN23E]|uniref:hypothetical protein n=1 Tax=Shewanella sp. GXUN23E TaxID=3422498 RepID=UPI003D7E3C17